MPARSLRLALVTAAASTALFVATPVVWAFPWSIDMYRGQNEQPLAIAPRVMPQGTIPVTGGEPPMTGEEMAARERNPLRPTPQNLARGKALFMTFCLPCHGKGGTGNGAVAHLLRRKPANLLSDHTRNLPDGYIYGQIRDGGKEAMPSYNDAMSSHERWQVVLFVRQLQKAGSQETAAGK